MGYVRLADNEDFSHKYDTYIIGYFYDEWWMMCEFFKCPKLTFEDAMEISKTLYKYDVEILDIIMGEDDD